MNCNKCGQILPEGSLFCTHCGNRMEPEAVLPLVQESPMQQPVAEDDPLLSSIWIEEEKDGTEPEDEWDEKTAWSGNPAYAAALRQPAEADPFMAEPAPGWKQVPASIPRAPAAGKRFCTGCGAALAPGERFCTKCGADASAAPVRSPAAPAMKPPKPEAPAKKKSILPLIIVAVVVLAVIVVSAVLLLGGDGETDPNVLAEEMVKAYLWDKKPAKLMDQSASFDDEDLEDDMLEHYEDTLEQLKDAGFRLKNITVDDFDTYDNGEEYDGYQEYLEEMFGIKDDAEKFREYEFRVEYQSTFYKPEDDNEGTIILVTLVQLDEQWYLLSLDVNNILTEIAQSTPVPTAPAMQ